MSSKLPVPQRQVASHTKAAGGQFAQFVGHVVVNYDAFGVSAGGPPYLDVNADGLWTALDAFLMINRLNSQAAPEGKQATLVDHQLLTWPELDDLFDKSRNRNRLSARVSH